MEAKSTHSVAHKLRRGFLQRTAAAVALCVASGLLLIVPGVSSDKDEYQTPNLIVHSQWQQWQPPRDDESAPVTGGIKSGSFELTRPQSELYLSGLAGEWRRIISSAAVDEDDIERYLHSDARSRLTETEAQGFREWLMQRRLGVEDRLLFAAADYTTDYLSAAAMDSARGLSFIRTIEWDYQTALGERRWQSGISALGALRESETDAVVWQLRAYAAEESSAGANAGLIYRRAVDIGGGGGLVGVNAFLDYEQYGNESRNFLRWSLGGEYRSTYADLYVNRYFPITEPRADGNEYVYTQGGIDVQLNINVADFGIGDVSGGLTYYRWEGEYGDTDDEGLRYHLRVSPDRGNLHLELELDAPEGGGTKLGGKILYRYVPGEAERGSSSLSAATFDPRAYFFNQARREYAQRIRHSEGAGEAVLASVVAGAVTLDLSPLSGDAAERVVLDFDVVDARKTIIFDNRRTVSISAGSGATLSVGASGWMMTIYESSEVGLLEESTRAHIVTGTLYVDRSSGLEDIVVGGATITLAGTRLRAGRVASTLSRGIELVLEEGIISLAVSTTVHSLIEIVGLSATAFVERLYVQDSPPLPIACTSARLRANHKLLDGSYSGCRGDVLMGDVAVGAAVSIHAQGDDLILDGLAGGMVSVAGHGQKWQRYPFYPGTAAVITRTAPAEVRYGDDAIVTVELASTLEFARNGAVSINITVRGGTVSDIGAARASVSCPSQLTPRSEGDVSVVAVCGDAVEFIGADDARVASRVNIRRLHTVSVAGGNGDYNFELTGPGGELVLMNDNGSEAVLALMSPRLINGEVYKLRALPRDERIGRYVESAAMDVSVYVSEAFVVQQPVAAEFRTELDEDIPLLTVFSSGRLGKAGYEIVRTTPADAVSGFALGDGGGGVVLSLVAPLATQQTISVIASMADKVEKEPALGSVAMITITVRARHPGAVTASYRSVSSVTMNGYAVYDTYYRGQLLEMTDVGNEGLSGIRAGSGYNYGLLEQGVTVQNGVHFQADFGGTRVAQAPANLPMGRHTLTMLVNDDHSVTPPLMVEFSVEIVAPLTLTPPAYTVAVNSSGRNVSLATVTASAGAPSYAYSINDVSPPAAAGLFSLGDDRVVIFNGTPDFVETTVADVRVNVQDALGAVREYALEVSIFSPLSSSPSPRQVIHQSYQGAFYTIDAVSGGNPPYRYNLTAVSGDFNAADFAVSSGGEVSALRAPGRAGEVQLLLEISDTSGGVINDYPLIVAVSDSVIEFAPALTTVDVLDSAAGEIHRQPAAWSSDDFGALVYRLESVTPAAPALSADAQSAALELSSPLPAGDVVLAQLEASATSENIHGFAPATLTVNIRSFAPLALEGISMRFIAPSPSGRLLYTLKATGGSGQYRYSALSAQPGDIVGLSNDGILSQLRAVAANEQVVLQVQADDAGGAAVAAAQAMVTIAWEEITPVNPDGQLLVLGGNSGGALNDVWTSSDGAAWRQLEPAPAAEAFSARETHAAAVLKNTVYIAGGAPGDIWSSTNAADWQLAVAAATAAFADRNSYELLAYDNALFMLGGIDDNATIQDNVYTSADGVNWTAQAGALFTPRYAHAAAVHNGSLFVLGGVDASGVERTDAWVWDGSSWEQHAGTVPFGGELSGSAASFHGRLYVISSGSDVYSSVNGVEWSEETDDAPFGTRPILRVQGTLMFALGGGGVWTSQDGGSWTVAANSPEYSPREQFAAAVFTPPPLALRAAENITLAETVYDVADLPLLTIKAFGGAAPYVYALDSALPALGGNVSVNVSAGIITDKGLVTELLTRADTNAVTIVWRVTDNAGVVAQAETTLSVAASVDIAPKRAELSHALPQTLPDEGLVLTTFSGIDGAGEYKYKIISVEPPQRENLFSINTNGDLILRAEVSQQQVITVRVEVSDDYVSATAAAELVWYEPAADGYLVLIGGEDANKQGLPDVWASYDGERWQLLTENLAHGNRPLRQAAAVHNSMVYVSGTGTRADNVLINDILRSEDSKEWEILPRSAGGLPLHADHAMVAYNATLFVLGGREYSIGNEAVTDDVWSSVEGALWTAQTVNRFSARERLAAAVHNGRVFVIGGLNADGEQLKDIWVWSGDRNDGWERKAEGAQLPFGGVLNDTAVSYKGRIYLLDSHNNVWSSAGGVKDWRLETDAPNSEDFGNAGAVHAFNALLVKGARLYVVNRNGMWYSEDGGSWKEAEDGGAYPVRDEFAAVVYNVPLGLRAPETVTLVATATGGAAQLTLKALGGDSSFYRYELDSVDLPDQEGGARVNSKSGKVTYGGLVKALLEDKERDTVNIMWRVTDGAANRALARTLLTVVSSVRIGVDDGGGGVTALDKALTIRQELPSAAGVTLTTFSGIGGDGNYRYSVTVTEPAGQRGSLSINSDGELIQSGAVDASLTIKARVAAADAYTSVSVSVVITWRDVLALSAPAQFTLADTVHNGVVFLTLRASGGDSSSYHYVLESLDHSDLESSVQVAINSGEVTENGLAATLLADENRNTVIASWRVTDGAGGGAKATTTLTVASSVRIGFDDDDEVVALGVSATIYQDMPSAAGVTLTTFSVIGGGAPYRYDVEVINPPSQRGSLFIDTVRNKGELIYREAVNTSMTVTVSVGVTDTHTQVSVSVVIIWRAPLTLTAPLTITAAKSVHDVAGTQLLTIKASSGTAPYTYALQPGQVLPGNVEVNSGSGVVTEAAAGGLVAALNAGDAQELLWQVTDDEGNTVQATTTLTVVSEVSTESERTEKLYELPQTLPVGGELLAAVRGGGGSGRIAGYSYFIAEVTPAQRRDLFTLDRNGDLKQTGVVTQQQVVTVKVEIKDGLTSATATVEVVWYTPAADGDLLVMGGEGGLSEVWSSSDGSSWQLLTAAAGFKARSRHAAAVFGGSVYISGKSEFPDEASTRGDIWSTTDGREWTVVTDNAGFGERSAHALAVYQDNLYALGGRRFDNMTLSEVWVSGDGESWAEETAQRFSARVRHAAVAHNGSLYVVGGRLAAGELASEVWGRDSDGNWQQLASDFPAAGVENKTAVSYRGKLYVLDEFEDLWSSTDGRSWSHEADVNINTLNSRVMLVKGSYLYVLSGSKVWRSEGGKSWQEVTHSSAYDPGGNFAAAVFNVPLALSAAATVTVVESIHNSAIFLTLAASGGDSSEYDYALESPAGNVQVDIDSGKVTDSGVVTELLAELADGDAGTVSIVWQVTDAAGISAKATTTLTVVSQVRTLGEVRIDRNIPSAAGTLRLFSASGGTGNYSYAVENFRAGSTFDESMFEVDEDTGALVQVNAVSEESKAHFDLVISDEYTQATAVVSVNWVAVPPVQPDGRLLLLGGGSESADRNDVWVSSGGAQWDEITVLEAFSARRAHAAAVNDGRVYIGGGADVNGAAQPGVWSSATGVRWTRVAAAPENPAPGLFDNALVSYNTQLVMLGGRDGAGGVSDSVWFYAEGAGWSAQPPAELRFEARYGHAAAVHNGSLFVLGGTSGGEDGDAYSDVWAWSGSGNWVRQTDNAPFGGELGAAAVSYKQRLYVLDGDDVWVSDDGVSWQLETDAAAFGAEDARVLLVQGVQMFAIGEDDVWAAREGSYWTVLTDSPAYPAPRVGFAAAVFTPQPLAVVSPLTLTLADTVHNADGAHLFTVTTAGGAAPFTYAVQSVEPDALAASLELDVSTGIAEDIGVAADEGLVQAMLQRGGFVTVVWTVTDAAGVSTPATLVLTAVSAVSGADERLDLVRYLPVADNTQLTVVSGSGGTGEYDYRIVPAVPPRDEIFDINTINYEGVLIQVGAVETVREEAVTLEIRDAYTSATIMIDVRYRVLPEARNGRLVVIAGQPSGGVSQRDVWASVDGAVWQELTSAAGFSARILPAAALFNNSLYISGGNNEERDIWRSADGISWEMLPVPEATSPLDKGRRGHAMVSFNNQLVMLGGRRGSSNSTNDIYVSSDGANWTEITGINKFPPRHYFSAVMHDGKLYVIGGQSLQSTGTFLSDVWTWDGSGDWQPVAQSAPFNGVLHQSAVSFNTSLYVVQGTTVWASSDGVRWAERTSDAGWYPGNFESHALLAQGEFMYYADDVGVWRSADGAAWSRVATETYPARRFFAGVVFAVSLTILAPPRLTVYYPPLDDAPLYTVTAIGGAGKYRYEIAGADPASAAALLNIDAASGELTRAESQATSLTAVLQMAVYDEYISATVEMTVVWRPAGASGELLLLGGETAAGEVNDVWLSVDGADWQQLIPGDPQDALPVRRLHAAAVLNNRVYISGGSEGVSGYADVWSSANGADWRRETARASFGTRIGHAMLTFNDELLVLSGSRSNVWASRDGKNWTNRSAAGFSQRRGLAAAVHNDSVYVYGGEPRGGGEVLDDIWTWDGSGEWRQLEVSGASPGRRVYGQMVSFRGRLYIIGGSSSSAIFSSEDGISWRQEPDAPFGAIQNHAAVVREGKIFVMGGSGNGNDESVWSFDGLQWVEEAETAFAARNWPSAVVFDMPFLFRPPATVTLTAGTGRTLLTLSAVGGEPAYSYALAETDPPGLEDRVQLDSASGVVTDTGLIRELLVRSPAVITLVWRGEDSAGADMPASMVVTVVTPPANPAKEHLLLIGGRGETDSYNDAWTSKEGAVWQELVAAEPQNEFPARSAHAAAVLNKRVYISGGFASEEFADVWSSANGAEWRQEVETAKFRARRDHAMLTFNNELLVLGGANASGQYGDVWASGDGNSWTQRSVSAFSPRFGHAAAVHKGSVYVYGGETSSGESQRFDDVWAWDGIGEWEQLVSSGALPGRLVNGQMVSFKGRLYIIGGKEIIKSWSSIDGIDWRPEPDLPVSYVFEHTAVVRGEKIYMLGNGFDDDSVWSFDGDAWTEETAAPGFGVRGGAAAAAFELPLYLAAPASLVLVDTIHNAGSGVLFTLTAAGGEPAYHSYALESTDPPSIAGAALSDKIQTDGASGVVKDDGLIRAMLNGGNSVATVVWRVSDAAGDSVIAGTRITVVTPVNAGESLISLHQMVSPPDDTTLKVFTPLGGTGNYSYNIVTAYPPLLQYGSRPVYTVNISGEFIQVISINVSMLAYTTTVEIAVNDEYTSASVTAVILYLTPRPSLPPGEGNLLLFGGFNKGTHYNDVWLFDQDDWHQITPQAEFSPRSSFAVAVLNSTLYISGGLFSEGVVTDEVWHSHHGSWTNANAAGLPRRYGHEMLAYRDRLFAIAGYDAGSYRSNQVYASADGTMWTQLTGGKKFKARAYPAAAVHDDRMFIIGGDGGGGSDVADGLLRDVWVSADGNDWRAFPDAPFVHRSRFAAVSHHGRLVVIGGIGASGNRLSDVWSSADGVVWRRETAAAEFGAIDSHTATSIGSKIYVTGGDGSKGTWSSSDGVSWTQESEVGDYPVRERHGAAVLLPPSVTPVDADKDLLAVSAPVLLEGENKNLVMRSPVSGEVSAATASFDRRRGFAIEVHNDILYLSGGLSDDGGRTIRPDIHHSYDGTVWIESASGELSASDAFLGRYWHQMRSHDDSLFIFSGTKDTAAGFGRRSAGSNEVWSSTDGSDWDELTSRRRFTPRHSAASAVHNGSLFIIGGAHRGTVFSDVWASADGDSWERLAASAQTPFAGRDKHAAVSFNGRLYVIAGRENTSDIIDSCRGERRSGRCADVLFTDVWSSADGRSWRLETANAAFGGQYNHAAVVRGSKMFVLAGVIGVGTNTQTRYTQVWSSSNGIVWRREANLTSGEARDGAIDNSQAAVVFTPGITPP